MRNTFILLDKNTNIEKRALMIVKFVFEEKEYLVYSVEENDQNSQIFVSRLILNSEGKYFIDNISSDEKGKLSNIVYNIVILIPTDKEKGNDFRSLVNNLFSKFSVKLLKGLPDVSSQEYYSNCSIAITNKVLVDNAVKLYNDELSVVNEDSVPMWTAPVEVTAPVDVSVNNTGVVVPVVEETVSPVQNTNAILTDNVVSQSNVGVDTPVNNEVVVPSVSKPEVASANVDTVVSNIDSNVKTTPPIVEEAVIMPNPQTEKLAVVSDPSLGINIAKPNALNNKEAGFTNTKYVVVGTVCLVLSIVVIITAYILIQNIV